MSGDEVNGDWDHTMDLSQNRQMAGSPTSIGHVVLLAITEPIDFDQAIGDHRFETTRSYSEICLRKPQNFSADRNVTIHA